VFNRNAAYRRVTVGNMINLIFRAAASPAEIRLYMTIICNKLKSCQQPITQLSGCPSESYLLTFNVAPPLTQLPLSLPRIYRGLIHSGGICLSTF